MVILPMTGKDLAEAIRESRSFLPTPHGGFLQVDDLCRVKGCSPSDSAILTEVAGAPLDLERVYSVATDHVLLTGMNKNETFIRLGNEHPVIKANKDRCELQSVGVEVGLREVALWWVVVRDGVRVECMAVRAGLARFGRCRLCV